MTAIAPGAKAQVAHASRTVFMICSILDFFFQFFELEGIGAFPLSREFRAMRIAQCGMNDNVVTATRGRSGASSEAAAPRDDRPGSRLAAIRTRAAADRRTSSVQAIRPRRITPSR